MRGHDEMSTTPQPKGSHTLGPLTITRGLSCLHVVSEDGQFSTGCISFDGKGQAYARLIAAAPKLLEALRAVIANHCANSDRVFCGTCSAARKVLAKIDGASE